MQEAFGEAAKADVEYVASKFNEHFMDLLRVDSGVETERTKAAMSLLMASGCNVTSRVEHARIGCTAARQAEALLSLMPSVRGLVVDNIIHVSPPGGAKAAPLSLSKLVINVNERLGSQQLFVHLAAKIYAMEGIQMGWRITAVPSYFTIFFAKPTGRVTLPEDLALTLFDMRDACASRLGGGATPVSGTGGSLYRVVSVVYARRSGGDACSCVYDPRRNAKQCYVLRGGDGGEGRLVDTDSAALELEEALIINVSFARQSRL